MPDSDIIHDPHAMVLRASELLAQSTFLLEHVIRIATEGTAVAKQVAGSIKCLAERPHNQLASSGGRLLYGARLFFASLKAGTAAKQAARAALDVRELIGGADVSPIHALQSRRASALTLHMAQDLLSQLSEAARLQAPAWQMDRNEADAIRHDIAAMAEAAKRNRMIANTAVQAIEVLLSQASNFTRVAKDSKWSIWS
ncbi:hypothetical protein [Pseudoduganella sp. UC29_71]|uniref:hypothetical protein n=1 Tax=Pseudoduganella sp. UC29_71 TaxID=3350174 RepID=UPI0036718725